MALPADSAADSSNGTGQRESTRKERFAAADAELSEMIDRLDAEIREKHPELYDPKTGKPKTGALGRFAVERSGGKRFLTEEDILALGRRLRRA